MQDIFNNEISMIFERKFTASGIFMKLESPVTLCCRIDTSDGIQRVYDIQTLNIKMWHVLEYNIHQIDTISHGQFHQGDTYVVRWHYMIAQGGRFSAGIRFSRIYPKFRIFKALIFY